MGESLDNLAASPASGHRKKHNPGRMCVEVIELPYGQFEFKLICMASPL